MVADMVADEDENGASGAKVVGDSTSDHVKENTKRNAWTYRRGHEHWKINRQVIRDAKRRLVRSNRSTHKAGLIKQAAGYEVSAPILLGEINYTSKRTAHRFKDGKCPVYSKVEHESELEVTSEWDECSYFPEHLLRPHEFKMWRPIWQWSLYGQLLISRDSQFSRYCGETTVDVMGTMIRYSQIDTDLHRLMKKLMLEKSRRGRRGRCVRSRTQKMLAILLREPRDPIRLPEMSRSLFHLRQHELKLARAARDRGDILTLEQFRIIADSKRDKLTKRQLSKRFPRCPQTGQLTQSSAKVANQFCESSSDPKTFWRRSETPSTVKGSFGSGQNSNLLRQSARMRHKVVSVKNSIRGVRRGTVDLDYNWGAIAPLAPQH